MDEGYFPKYLTSCWVICGVGQFACTRILNVKEKVFLTKCRLNFERGKGASDEVSCKFCEWERDVVYTVRGKYRVSVHLFNQEIKVSLNPMTV